MLCFAKSKQARNDQVGVPVRLRMHEGVTSFLVYCFPKQKQCYRKNNCSTWLSLQYALIRSANTRMLEDNRRFAKLLFEKAIHLKVFNANQLKIFVVTACNSIVIRHVNSSKNAVRNLAKSLKIIKPHFGLQSSTKKTTKTPHRVY